MLTTWENPATQLMNESLNPCGLQLWDRIYQNSFFQLLHSTLINDFIPPHLSTLLEISKTPWLTQKEEHTLQKLFAIDATDGDE